MPRWRASSGLDAARILLIALALIVAGCGKPGAAARPVRFKTSSSLRAPIGVFPYPPALKNDRRLALIKEKLRQQDFEVVDGFFAPANAQGPAMLGAIVRANYAKPSVDRVQDQALSVWSVLYVSLGSDVNVPETDRWFFVAGEYWTKYVLYLYLSVHDARKALRKFLAAGNDPAARSRAEDEMIDAIQFKVFDVERQKLVDEKEFQDKHFVDE